MATDLKIPVLTYHSTNISGNEYHNNDHMALEQDLKLLDKLGIEIISAIELVQWIKGEVTLAPTKQYVVLTFDDGCELDFYDWNHPAYGFQKSFYTLLKEYPKKIHATSFVIVSPDTRKVLEQTCLAGHKIWGDEWWQKAEDSQLISIENHSWDHVHVTLDQVEQEENKKGNFKLIKTSKDANAQIKQASVYIDTQITDKKTQLFAYPYGDYNNYLCEKYLPKEQTSIIAAFTCEASHIDINSNVWKIPRFVCGTDWKSVKEIEEIMLFQ
jgi:peptidoglycan/xylan/chitin deacetylase (PgdA/CDA1 family)